MRCPVPYAILVLFGWGLLDIAAARATAVVRRLGAIARVARRAGRERGEPAST